MKTEHRACGVSQCGHCVWRRVVEDEWWALSSCPASTVQSAAAAAAASADATRKACGEWGVVTVACTVFLWVDF